MTHQLGTNQMEGVSGGRGRSASAFAVKLEDGSPCYDLRRQLCDQNVFVFHLPSDWSEEELKSAFSRFGSILSAKVVKRPDGSSKGYGFVCFDSRGAALAAVEGMNGFASNGKRLKVSLKKTPEECLRIQVEKLLELPDMSHRPNECSLFVFHLPSTWVDNDIDQRFRPFGQLVSAKVALKEDGSSRGYGFVTYDKPRCAALAITGMNGVEVGEGKRLKVQLKQQSHPQHPAPGCTIFVFHIPNEWTDASLRQNFGHFGKILSAMVQRDADGTSRGYGFVSFDRQVAATNAITGMNGFAVGRKRLKVSLKKGEERYLQAAPATLVYPIRHYPGDWDSQMTMMLARPTTAPVNLAGPLHHPTLPPRFDPTSRTKYMQEVVQQPNAFHTGQWQRRQFQMSEMVPNDGHPTVAVRR